MVGEAFLCPISYLLAPDMMVMMLLFSLEEPEQFFLGA